MKYQIKDQNGNIVDKDLNYEEALIWVESVNNFCYDGSRYIMIPIKEDITMKLTREQAIYEHRKMWNWIADETLKRRYAVDKYDYFAEHPEYKEIPEAKCWCCEYAKPNNRYYCLECPVKWPNEGKKSRFQRLQTCCNNIGSPYQKWFDSFRDGYYQKLAELARQIANLPEREVE